MDFILQSEVVLPCSFVLEVFFGQGLFFSPMGRRVLRQDRPLIKEPEPFVF